MGKASRLPQLEFNICYPKKAKRNVGPKPARVNVNFQIGTQTGNKLDALQGEKMDDSMFSESDNPVDM